jgi:hypothetical protein
LRDGVGSGKDDRGLVGSGKDDRGLVGSVKWSERVALWAMTEQNE